jgi:hypothetical protein
MVLLPFLMTDLVGLSHRPFSMSFGGWSSGVARGLRPSRAFVPSPDIRPRIGAPII